MASYERDGHAHKVRVNGRVESLKSVVDHDDRKPILRWFTAQGRYAEHEADKLLGTERAALDWKDKLRLRILFAAPLTLVYCLIVKRLIFDGWPGLYYTFQRTLAELMLSIVLLDRRVRKRNP